MFVDVGSVVVFIFDIELQMGMKWLSIEIVWCYGVLQVYGVDIIFNNSVDMFI